jgi:hypothetical protein
LIILVWLVYEYIYECLIYELIRQEEALGFYDYFLIVMVLDDLPIVPEVPELEVLMPTRHE